MQFTFAAFLVSMLTVSTLARYEDVVWQNLKCIEPNPDFSNCKARDARAASCQDASSEESIACVCNQDFFDSIIGSANHKTPL